MSEVHGLVNAKKVHYPRIVVQTILNRWAMDCGKCGRPFVSWGFFQVARCPWCGAKNHAAFSEGY